jgi:hypothetical protein
MSSSYQPKPQTQTQKEQPDKGRPTSGLFPKKPYSQKVSSAGTKTKVPLLDQIKAQLNQIFEQPTIPEVLKLEQHSVVIGDIVPDLLYFRRQMAVFENKNLPYQAAAILRDAEGTSFPVLIQAPNLGYIVETYPDVLRVIKQSGIQLEIIDLAQATPIFVDRLSEFLGKSTAYWAPYSYPSSYTPSSLPNEDCVGIVSAFPNDR